MKRLIVFDAAYVAGTKMIDYPVDREDIRRSTSTGDGKIIAEYTGDAEGLQDYPLPYPDDIDSTPITEFQFREMFPAEKVLVIDRVDAALEDDQKLAALVPNYALEFDPVNAPGMTVRDALRLAFRNMRSSGTLRRSHGQTQKGLFALQIAGLINQQDIYNILSSPVPE